jgi:hypothetical protein
MSATPAINIVIPQGSDFEETYSSQEPDGSITDLTGYTGASSVKKHPGAVKSTPFTVGILTASGEVSIAMSSSTTVQLKPGRYYYDLYLTSPGGSLSRMVGGMVDVTAGITT